MAEITRRQFGKLAAALAAIPLDAFAAAPARRIAQGNALRIACIGLNGRGMSHVAAYIARTDVQLVAICDVDPAVMQRAEAYINSKAISSNGVRPYSDIRRLLDTNQIDAVSIATPNHWHALATIWALQSGKHVYVEKPVSHNVSEGRLMVKAARRWNRVCQGGTQARSHAACQKAVAYVQSGALGRVVFAQGLCYKPRGSIGIFPDSPAPAGIDYNEWLGPAPERPFNRNRWHYNWHWNWDYGNGDLGNQGVHQLDIARWAMGRDDLPTRVQALGGRVGYVDAGETPNTLVALYEWSHGAPLTFEVRGLPTPDVHGVRIGVIVHCERGYVVFSDDYARAIAFGNDHSQLAEFRGGGDHFENFVQAARSGSANEMTADIEKGHISSAMCHLANISYRLGREAPIDAAGDHFRSGPGADAVAAMRAHMEANRAYPADGRLRIGRPITFDAARETIHNDSAARAMLTRAYRRPFAPPAI